ncbi:MAG: acyl--CoA ligase [Oscillospiraceae bacterium]|nr:acyl--CoA ligase [Oscillospiraceae bacterium]
MARDSVAALIQKRALNTPDKMALVVDGQAFSYGELNNRIKSAAGYLAAQGVKAGSHVLTVAVPGIDYVANMYAILALGAVHIPAENKVPEQRLAEIAGAVDADFVLSDNYAGATGRWIDAGCVGYGEPCEPWEPVPVSDECSEIVFTTGTTGKSKGVMLSSRCLDVYLATMNESFQLDENSVFLLTTPLNHVGGMHRIHQCMAAGSTLIMMDGIRDLKAFFRYANDYGVTHTYLPPASVKLLITLAKKELAKLDGKIRFIYTASAPFPVADIERLIELMPHTHLHQGYGSSETGSICNCCYNAPGESVDCLGKPYACVEVILQDENGEAVHEPYRAGLIRSRSGMNMLGYYNEPELTASVLKDGFVYSNDLMFFDERGNLYFAGRGDDVINTKGFKVAPTEVENFVLKFPDVLECICIPYEDAVQGRVIKLLVRMNEGKAPDQEALGAYLAERLEAYKVPKYIEAVEEIAKTANGKINRKLMIQKFSNL